MFITNGVSLIPENILADTANPKVPPMFNIFLKIIENMLMINGNIFQYVKTELSAEIVIKTGNP